MDFSNLSQAEFRDFALELVKQEYPDLGFEGSEDDPEMLSVKEASTGLEFKVGLQNTYKDYHRSDKSEKTEQEVRELLLDYFGRVVPSMLQYKEDALSWKDVKELIRPQFIPPGFMEGIELVSTPFAGQLKVGYVIDGEDSYSYVAEEDFAAWGITKEALRTKAIENLDAGSKGLELSVFEGDGKFVIAQGNDAFDAARILVPKFRKKLCDLLGAEFYAGLPNRDLLVAWQKDSGKELHDKLAERIHEDVESQPYPLTADILLVTEAEVRTKSEE